MDQEHRENAAEQTGPGPLAPGDWRYERVLGDLHRELGRSLRARHQRRIATKVAGGAVCIALAALLVRSQWPASVSTPRPVVVEPGPGAGPGKPEVAAGPERQLEPAVADSRPRAIADCGTDGQGRPTAMDGVCLLNDDQLIAALAAQTGESYGIIRTEGHVRVVKNVQ